jgi:hypothetical protein
LRRALQPGNEHLLPDRRIELVEHASELAVHQHARDVADAGLDVREAELRVEGQRHDAGVQNERLGVALDARLRESAARRREHEAVAALKERLLLAAKRLIGRR